EFTGETDQYGEQVKILSTYEGTDQPNLIDKIPTFKEVHTNTLDINPGPETVEHVQFTREETVDAIPIIPIRPRAGLEAVRRVRRERDPGYVYMGGSTPEQERRWERDRSPRLVADPGAQLRPDEELSWYRDLLRERRGEDYLEELD